MTNNSQSATAYFSNGSTGPVLRLTNGGAAGNPGGSGGGNFIEAWNELESDIQFRVTTTGQARSDVGFTTPAQDFAEMMPAARGVTPGDVLAIGFGGKLVRSNHAFQDTVLGVYSTQPGFLGGQAVEGDVEGTVPLALVGIVPVKVTAENGPIFAGDMLVASNTAGRAMNAGSDAPQGTVIGKALETLGGEQGVIQMLVLLQ